MNPNKTKSVDDVIKELEDMDLNVICKDDCKHKIHTLQLTNEGFAVFQDAISYLHRAKVMSEALEYYANPDEYLRERKGASGQNYYECYDGVVDVAIQALQQFKGDAK